MADIVLMFFVELVVSHPVKRFPPEYDGFLD